MIDINDLNKLNAKLIRLKENIPTLINKIINENLDDINKKAFEQVGKEWNINQNKIKESKIKKAPSKGGNSSLTIPAKRIPNRFFKNQQNKQGVWMNFRKDNRYKSFLKSAFLTKKGKVVWRKIKPGYPIVELYGPPISFLFRFNNSELVKKILVIAKKDINEDFNRKKVNLLR